MKIANSFRKLAKKRNSFKASDRRMYLFILFNVLLHTWKGKTSIHLSALTSNLRTNEKVNKRLIDHDGFKLTFERIGFEMYITDISWDE